jgi:pyridoxal 5'-phosphate synthase pdxS subunit
MLQLGAEAIFVGSGIFKSDNPPLRAKAIVEAAAHYEDADLIARVSEGIGEAMAGLDICKIPEEELLAKRGW